MAEKRFIKGLFKDTAHIDQPAGSWRYAKNAIINDKKGSISNEGGTNLNAYLQNDNQIHLNHKVVGAIEVEGDRVVLFMKKKIAGFDSSIGIWEDGLFTTLYDPDAVNQGHDLNFDLDYPIEGTYKIDSKGDLVVYWTDDLNPPRAFNVDRQQRALAASTAPNPATELYGINAWAADDKHHIGLLNLFPYSGAVPHITITEVISPPFPGSNQSVVTEGGSLRTGVYYLALAYVDEDLVATNFLTVANPISIVEEFDHTEPVTQIDGGRAGNQTSKAIRWEVSNLNTDYKFVRPVIIRKMGDATEAFKLDDIELQLVGTSGIIFSGMEGFTPTSVEDVIIDTISYETAKTINQLDGVLYVGNLTGSKDVGYQKYANFIKLSSEITLMPNFDTFFATVDNFETGFGTRPIQSGDPASAYRWIPTIYDRRGYMRDEIYAFYIAFIMNDGSMSYAYHIPGRSALTSINSTTTPTQGDNILSTYEIPRVYQDGTTIGPFFTSGTNYSELGTVTNPDLNELSPANSRLYHFYDTSNANTTFNSGSAYDSGCRHMNYWENSNEFYPFTDDFETWDAQQDLTENTTSGNNTLNLQGTNVRHHHFPSNENWFRRSIISNDSAVNSSVGTDSTRSRWNDTLVIMTDCTPTVRNEPTAKIRPFRGSCSFINDGNEPDVPDSSTSSLSAPMNGSQGQYTVQDMASALYDFSSGTFIADQSMIVRVDWYVAMYKYNSASSNSSNRTYARLRCTSTNPNNSSTGTFTVSDDSIMNWNPNCCNWGSTVLQRTDFNQAGIRTVYLDPGDTLYLETYHRAGNNTDARVANTSLCSETASGGGCNKDHYLRFEVEASTIIPDHTLWDLALDHTVSRLGFNLDALKIPKEIADKVQGFRIYYANREHGDKTIIGQDALVPMSTQIGVLGICAESSGTTDTAESQQIMNVAQTTEEIFNTSYPFTQDTGASPSYFSTVNGDEVYKISSFHDFNLLRTRNSLVPATHIKVEYVVDNYAFNAPTIRQDKKKLTRLASSGGLERVEEFWDWDITLNCYPEQIYGAIFLGGVYRRNRNSFFNGFTSSNLGEYNFVLGQKSKTYILGDSIFEGGPLGFGGKIFNEFGESHIALGLGDNNELPTLNNQRATAAVADNFGDYMFFHVGAPAILVEPTGGAQSPSGLRSRSYIANLKAFKTDLYKSIDTNDLVWTGYEVLGDELQRFTVTENGDAVGPHSNDTNATSLSNAGINPNFQTTGIYGGDTFLARYGKTLAVTPSNSLETANPYRAIHHHIVESCDNINFRHSEDDDSLYFPGTFAKHILQKVGHKDFTSEDNIKYNDNYSEVNNLRPAFPLPSKIENPDDFPTRTHRSAKTDTSSLIDNYRIFLANQFKDLPKNRGDLWKLASFSNLLYFHMEETLYKAKGKQSMQMKDGSEAFVGSGDIFAQEPDEVVQVKGGFGGTQSQWAALTTRHGYFFVDRDARKVFLMKDQLAEISKIGMETWFRDNLKFKLEDYGYKGCIDNPIVGSGFHSVWDPKYKRIILTKREFIPTQRFKDDYKKLPTVTNQGVCGTQRPNGYIEFFQDECVYKIWGEEDCAASPCPCSWSPIKWTNERYFDKGGWTISYYPDMGIWVSFHDYIPYIYFKTSTNFYSLTDQHSLAPADWSNLTVPQREAYAQANLTVYANSGIWEHNSDTKGILYMENESSGLSGMNNEQWLALISYASFEFELIHNEITATDRLYSSFNYTLETFNTNNISVLEHGFTSFYLYNTLQLSGETDLEYLINTRRVGNNWKVNKFRDMAAIALDTSNYYTPTGTNIIGGTNTGTITTSSTQNMFTVDGMSESINTNYIDLTKTWDKRRKFIDKWLGIRLIYNNISNNLLNLYSTNVEARKLYR
tara:strand:+ start:2211 stop:7823 length:5613 start_codon:yes stop_codon:yes gene_type:complete